MTDFYLNSIAFKAFPNSEDDVKAQLEILVKLVEDLRTVSPDFSNWYVNNGSDLNPPLEYSFPSESSFKYLLKLRKKDAFQSFLLWNGQVDNSLYASISLSIINISLSLQKRYSLSQLVDIFQIILKYLPFKYLYLSNPFFMKNRVFDHRQPVSSICYVPKALEDKELPYIYQKIEVNTSLNQGTILIFDQNLFDESEQMKKKIQENSIALVDLDLIPETELSPDFFNEVEF